jgi:SAM-dependent methyltransferase
MEFLDDPARADEIQKAIQEKALLKSFYLDMYRRYAQCIEYCPPTGAVIEIGSGCGFAKHILPQIITSDLIPYPGIDCVIDATKMPFGDFSLRAILMLNVFHHIPDVAGFLSEAERCLMPNGRLLIIDQHSGMISKHIYRYLHFESYDRRATDWSFSAEGPLSAANGALPWIVFQRDLDKFTRGYPSLELLSYRPHTPLKYWLSGGLRKISLVPSRMLHLVSKLDRNLTEKCSDLGSFVDIEIKKK